MEQAGERKFFESFSLIFLYTIHYPSILWQITTVGWYVRIYGFLLNLHPRDGYIKRVVERSCYLVKRGQGERNLQGQFEEAEKEGPIGVSTATFSERRHCSSFPAPPLHLFTSFEPR